ncbi:MAG: hypothetical protein ACUVRY_04080 [Thermoanaerobaculaceae bacterium]
MDQEPPNLEVNEDELAYYRAVEDHFCRLRGTPFLFSPKDFAYLRQWWNQGIPLSAVLVGLGEVFAKRRKKGLDPVSSLAYCRHAVARHAKRLAQARAGEQGRAAVSVAPALEGLEVAVRKAQEGAPSLRVKEVLATCLATLKVLPRDLPPATLSEMLAELEEQTLRSALEALEVREREALEAAVKRDLPPGEELTGRVLEVALLRALRDYLCFPRLELSPDGA